MQRVCLILAAAVSAATVVSLLLSHGNAEEPIAKAKQSPEETIRVNYSQLGQDVEVIGALGRPLGKLLAVEGSLFERKPDERIPKIYESKTVFIAERVNGEPLKEPVHIFIKPAWNSEYEDLEPKRKVKLIGYEDGGFVAESEDVWAFRRKRGEHEAARMQRRFNVDFYVLDAQPFDARR